MLIGLDVRKQEGPQLVFALFLEEIASHGWLRNNRQCLDPVQEAEYRAMAITTAELTWFQCLLVDLYVSSSQNFVLYCDNISAFHLTVNPVFHAGTKHIEIDYGGSSCIFFRSVT